MALMSWKTARTTWYGKIFLSVMTVGMIVSLGEYCFFAPKGDDLLRNGIAMLGQVPEITVYRTNEILRKSLELDTTGEIPTAEKEYYIFATKEDILHYYGQKFQDENWCKLEKKRANKGEIGYSAEKNEFPSVGIYFSDEKNIGNQTWYRIRFYGENYVYHTENKLWLLFFIGSAFAIYFIWFRKDDSNEIRELSDYVKSHLRLR